MLRNDYATESEWAQESLDSDTDKQHPGRITFGASRERDYRPLCAHQGSNRHGRPRVVGVSVALVWYIKNCLVELPQLGRTSSLKKLESRRAGASADLVHN